MKQIFKEYGGVIIVVIAIVALITLVSLLMKPGGVLDGAFGNITQSFVDKTQDLVDGAGNGGSGDAALPQLATPAISLSGTTLTITPVANATGYEVYNGSELLTTTTEVTVDLATYLTEPGSYTVKVRATGSDDYKASA